MLRTKEENRIAIAELFADKRGHLGDERFNQLVDEISNVRLEALQKLDSLPKAPIGVLDSNEAERLRLSKEEDMKWLLIKQKYGI
ncbi:hypothetical protein [Cohnella abietis]|uniref:Uncharacterized protein n=1 Tax=Cohnella abietis TaxID=2507935 RepID=A0A3T1D1R9_9BACL|nr:hypothetical protein [Cohnella abietis]BBI32034.1 hypothetical protein KCTCHS21_14330 [Cohnella abietis]